MKITDKMIAEWYDRTTRTIARTKKENPRLYTAMRIGCCAPEKRPEEMNYEEIAAARKYWISLIQTGTEKLLEIESSLIERG